MMSVTVLGNWGAYPEAGEATAGLLLHLGGDTEKTAASRSRKILIDCGSGVLAQCAKFTPIGTLEAVFLSHFHHDHCADIGSLQYAVRLAFQFQRRSEVLPIYAPNRSDRFEGLRYRTYTEERALDPAEALERDGLRVTVAPTVHDEYNLAMRFEYGGRSLVYTGDMGPASAIDELCAGADLLICESCLPENETGLLTGHMTTREAGDLARRTGVKRLMLTHFPHGSSDGPIEGPGGLDLLKEKMAAETRRVFPGTVLTAQIGKTYSI